MFSDPATFARATRELLALERQAEAEATAKAEADASLSQLQEQGLALVDLQVDDDETGLDGRRRLELIAMRGASLPAHRFRPGTPVRLGAANLDAPLSAVVSRSARDRVRIVLDEEPEEGLKGPLHLLRRPGDQSWQRILKAVDRLERFTRGPAARMLDLAFKRREPSDRPLDPLTPLNDSLDAAQRDAVAFALASVDLALVHGPPGTGKTTTLVEIIRQEARRGSRVLACAPTNVAVDNLAESLAAAGLDLVRLGHPARVHPLVQEHTLDAKCARHEHVQIGEKLRREAQILQRRAERQQDRDERKAMWQQVRQLRAEMRELEGRAREEILAHSSVVLSTVTGAGQPRLADLEFDVVVVDEAAQCLEAAIWIPLLKGRRAILAGDHRQLPAVLHSVRAEREGLGTTLFRRLIDDHGERLSRMLVRQFRMNEAIMSWSSREFYEERLVADPSVAGHRLDELEHVASDEDSELPLLLIDTAGCDYEERLDARGESRSNQGEAELVAKHLRKLAAAGVTLAEVAVITPYLAQVQLIRQELGDEFPELEIDSVDGFQGREKEAVILSLVRSNHAGEIGFLADERRLNVAITRARRQLVVIGDTATVGRNPLIARLIDHCSDAGEYRSAWQYMD